MKKILSIVLVGVLTFSLTACGSSDTTENVQEGTSVGVDEIVETDNDISEDVEELVVETAAETEDVAEVEEETMETAEGGNVLVAVFSWSGNTKQLADMIQSETGGDLFEIAPQTPYTDDYNTLLDVAQQEKSDNARPALSAQVDNWDDYSTIFVGYPNWWGDAPMIILSFLESYDCTGKTIVPFCTSGGGGFGGSISSIEGSATGATMADGFHVGGSRVGSAQEDVAAWIDGLGL